MNNITYTDNQMALDYTIYMIVSSYFDKAACGNTMLERKMRARYWGLKAENQYRMEETCINYMENKLLPLLPERFLKETVRVRLLPNRRSGRTEIRFEHPDYILRMRGEYKGRKTKLFYQVWKRKSHEKTEEKTGAGLDKVKAA